MKNKTVTRIFTFFGIGMMFMLSSGCSKDEEPIMDPQIIPTITTLAISDIKSTTAVTGGEVTSGGSSPVIFHGVCWNTLPSPYLQHGYTRDGSGTGNFTSKLTGLYPNTTYYVRAYAMNTTGTAYGNEVSFKTSDWVYETITDIDGNVYRIVTIGAQVWMVDNLKTTRFNNGDSIPLVVKNSTRNFLTTPGYCFYNNDTAYKNIYGALYNWYAVNTGKLAPAGWHIPTDEEWETMVEFLGGENSVGGLIKATGTIEDGTGLWFAPNSGATNGSGFSAIPGGRRNDSGDFTEMGKTAFWWTADVIPYDDAHNVYVNYYPGSFRYWIDYKTSGCSVRCVMDK